MAEERGESTEESLAPPAPAPTGGSPFADQAVLGVLAAYALFRLAAPFLSLPPKVPLLAVIGAAAVSSVLSIGLPIAAIAGLVRREQTPRVGVAVLLAGVLLLAVGIGLTFVRLGMASGLAAAVVLDLGKILAAAGFGILLAAGLKELNLLLPAGIFAAFADFVVVHYGTVKQALAPGNTKGQALVQAVSAHVPKLHPALPTLTIGPADFLFLGIFLACAARFGLGLQRNAVALAAVLAVSLVAVLVVGPIPALAPMSVTFVAMNWRRFRLTRDESISTAVVLVLVGGLFFAYFRFVTPGGR